ncbi:MAG: glycosyl hydrolase, partial [Myxococcaceae bacterium]|nr:glycosyl hydrolase [Myxococcaceae bacterium]
TILGEWNGFNPEPMERDANGVASFRRTLEPRDYGYRFAIGKAAATPDPANAFRRWAGNVEHSRLRVPDCAAPLIEVTKFVSDGAATGTFEAQALRGSKGAALLPPAVTLDGAAITAGWEAATGKLSLQQTGLAVGKHRLVVTLADATGKQAERLYLPFWVEPAPFEWGEALLYFVFTDRFRNGDLANDAPTANVELQANYQGGDFRGVITAIEEGYFDKLGVRAIWLSPVDANPDGAFPGSYGKLYTGYHGYWPSKAREVQFRFGNLLDLQELTTAAHQHGIRVIADLVLNHTHQDHPYFRDHKADGWYNTAGSCICGEGSCTFDARPLDCWFTNYLPDFNWRSPAQNEQLVQDALFWLETADLDGFRLDAVKHLDHVGGRNIAGAVNAIADRTGIDFYLVGETFTGSNGRAQIAEYVGPDELDGQFDFPLYWPVIDAFAKGGSLKGVDAAIAQNEAFYAPGTLNSPFLGNHDVARFISAAAGQLDADPGAQAWNNRPPDQVTSDLAFSRAKWAFTFLLTQRGVPLVYYGDEIGLPGAGDPDNRRLMKFGATLSARETALLEHVQKLGTARKQSQALRFGDRATLVIEDDLYVFQRDSSADGALVAINRGAARQVSVTVKGELAKAAPRSYRDVLSGKTVLLGGPAAVTLSLDPASAALYLPAN